MNDFIRQCHLMVDDFTTFCQEELIQREEIRCFNDFSFLFPPFSLLKEKLFFLVGPHVMVPSTNQQPAVFVEQSLDTVGFFRVCVIWLGRLKHFFLKFNHRLYSDRQVNVWKANKYSCLVPLDLRVLALTSTLTSSFTLLLTIVDNPKLSVSRGYLRMWPRQRILWISFSWILLLFFFSLKKWNKNGVNIGRNSALGAFSYYSKV